MLCKKSTPLQFIPNLKYLFKVSVTVTYSQRQEYLHFVGAPTLSVCPTSILTHIESRPNIELASGNCES